MNMNRHLKLPLISYCACRPQLRCRSSKPSDSKLNDVVIAAAVRTPVGSFRGNFAALTATQLGALVIEMSIKQAAIPFKEVQEVFMGTVSIASVGQTLARQAALSAGLHEDVSCITVNEADSTGMQSTILAIQRLQLGHAKVIVCGGMESTSNGPYYLGRSETQMGSIELQDGILCKTRTATHMSCDTVEQIAQESQKEYIKTAYTKLAEAWATGVYDAEVMPVRVNKQRKRDVLVEHDETLKNVSDPETLGNCNVDNNLADGAAALVLTTSAAVQRLQLKPLARVIAYEEIKTNALYLGSSATQMVQRLLANADILSSDIAMWEIDDVCPFAVLTLIKEMPLNAACVNVHGSGVCLGHALAMSGPRLVTHLAHALQPGTIGCAVTCSESGAISAVLIKKL